MTRRYHRMRMRRPPPTTTVDYRRRRGLAAVHVSVGKSVGIGAPLHQPVSSEQCSGVVRYRAGFHQHAQSSSVFRSQERYAVPVVLVGSRREVGLVLGYS